MALRGKAMDSTYEEVFKIIADKGSVCLVTHDVFMKLHTWFDQGLPAYIQHPDPKLSGYRMQLFGVIFKASGHPECVSDVGEKLLDIASSHTVNDMIWCKEEDYVY